MLGDNKNVFWEALLLTCAVFALGFVIGVIYENNNLDEINSYYVASEISLVDILAMESLMDLDDTSCDVLIKANLEFADRIYEEARLLEQYEEAGKLNEALKLAHKKYDLMRTFLWINTEKTYNTCGEDSSYVVYLYEQEEEELIVKAKMNVWARILGELKAKKGDDIILIPIAVDSDLVSLNTLIEPYDIQEYPVLIINEEIITKVLSVEDLEPYLN